MDCREEVALIERRFKNLAGVEDFSADLIGQRLHVKYDSAKLNANAIAGAIADAGMRAWLEHEEPIASPSGKRTRTRLLAAADSIVRSSGTEAIRNALTKYDGMLARRLPSR